MSATLRPVSIARRVGTVAAFMLAASTLPLTALPATDVPDMSGTYEFLSPDNTLGILEEEGKLKGYIDVAQGEDESDAVLTFQITLGTRKGDQVEFRTAKIHERYYRFSGTVERGKGRKDSDPDFLHLTGALEIVQLDSATGEEKVEKRRETFKWKGKPPAEEGP